MVDLLSLANYDSPSLALLAPRILRSHLDYHAQVKLSITTLVITWPRLCLSMFPGNMGVLVFCNNKIATGLQVHKIWPSAPAASKSKIAGYTDVATVYRKGQKVQYELN